MGDEDELRDLCTVIGKRIQNEKPILSGCDPGLYRPWMPRVPQVHPGYQEGQTWENRLRLRINGLVTLSRMRLDYFARILKWWIRKRVQ